VAADNLRAGLSVVADCVSDIALTRAAWSDVASNAAASLLNVEVICADPAEHRRRVETRRADLDGQVLPDWRAVMSRRFEPWAEPRLVLDTASVGIADAVACVVAHIPAPPPSV
jgi:predicted kinase